MARRRKKARNSTLVTLLLLFLVIFGAVLGWDRIESWISPQGRETLAPVSIAEGEAQFHFIDVGQGDSILIMTPEGNVLVDAGPNSSEAQLKMYLDDLGVTALKYAVFTHPDEDHIGGADMILSDYQVEHVLLPDLAHTSKTYEKMIAAIEASEAQTLCAEPGQRFSVGGMDFHVLAPIGTEYSGRNNYSVVLKAVFGSTSVLLTGDAETESEQDILARYDAASLKSDLLKVGHHGSATSTTEAFLEAVSPSFAVISVGQGNSYDHPKAVTLNKLRDAGVTVYRTDLEGSVVFVTDGTSLRHASSSRAEE